VRQHVGRHHEPYEVNANDGEEEAEGAAECSEDEAFTEQLPNDSAATRAKGGANRNLTRAIGGSHQLKVRDVETGDQQDKHASRDECQPGRVGDVCDVVSVDWT